MKVGVMYKLDLEKAYHHVSWHVLLELLRMMNFGDKWLQWIKSCICAVRFSILLNGNPEGLFKSFICLREEDPLSPYQFVIVMEALSLMLRRAEMNGWIKCFEIVGKENKKGGDLFFKGHQCCGWQSWHHVDFSSFVCG